MSKIIFGNTVDLLTAGTPSSDGYIVAYDLDGILKQKDEFGVITPIGGGPTGGIGATPSLYDVLSTGNDTITQNIIMGTSTSILSSNGGGRIDLGSEVSITTDNSSFGEGWVYITATQGSIGYNTTFIDTYEDYIGLYLNNIQQIKIGNNSTASVSSTVGNKFGSIISSNLSTISAGVVNSVILGGVGISATQSNFVYVGGSLNINNSYTLPNSDGINGYIMVTDGSGNVTWQPNVTSVSPLHEVLAVGNSSETYDIIMGTQTVIKSINGGGQVELDYGATSSVLISTDNGVLSKAYVLLNNSDLELGSPNNTTITTGDLDLVSSTDIVITANDTLAISGQTGSVVIGDGRGLVYGFDYSSGFVNNSLVSKLYVDNGTASLWSELNNYLPLSGGTLTGNLIVNGDLTVSGTQTVINTENLYVEDNIITLNATYSGPATVDSGIEVNLGDGTYSKVLWDAGTGYWQVGLSGSESTIITEAGSGLLKSNNTLSVDFGTVSSISYVDAGTASIWAAINSSDTLAEILAVGNTSSADIIMTEGDDIVFKYSGWNNRINTLPLTTHRNINFPDASGTVLVGNGNVNYLSKWSAQNSLTNSIIYDDGSFVGVGITNSNAKLHINNTGLSASFLVEDSTTPDSTPFIIDNSGNVGIGTTGPGTKLHVTKSSSSIDLTKWNSTYAVIPNSPILVSGDSGSTDLLITNDNTAGTSQLVIGPNSGNNALFIRAYGPSAAGTLSQNTNLTLNNSVGFLFQTDRIYLTSSIGGSKEIFNVNEVGTGYLSQRIGGFGILQDVNSNIHSQPEAAFTAKLRNQPQGGYPSRLLWLENLTDYTSNSGSQDLANIVNNATVGIGLTLSGTMLLVDDQINSNMNLFRVKKQGQDKLIIDPNGRIGVNSSTLSSSRMYVLANNGEYAGYFDATDEIGVYSSSTDSRGVYSISTNSYGAQAISTNSYGLVAQSANSYAIWSQSTSVSTKLSILSNGQCDFNSYDDSVKILRLEDNGNVGVGTASPTSKLMVWNGDVSIARTQDAAGTAIPARLLLLGDYNNSSFTEDQVDEVVNAISFRSDGFSTTASAFGYDISQTNIGGSSGKLFITNLTGGVPRLLMSFQDNGNVGIGTASPTTEFHIWATQSGAFRLQDTTQGNGNILVSDSNGVGTWASPETLGISTKYTEFGLSLTANTPSTITHNLGTQSIICQAWDTSTGETLNVVFKNRATNSVDILSTVNVTVDVIIQG